MKGSDFIFDTTHILYYKCRKINLNQGRSNTDFPDWIKNKKATRNPINDDYKYFQYTVTVALKKQKEKRKEYQKFFFPWREDHWVKIMKNNNLIIALNVSHAKIKKLYSAFVSKKTSKHEKQIILSMIPNEEDISAL